MSATPGMFVLQIGHEVIHRFGKRMETLFRQMGVNGCRLGAAMPQEFLDHAQVYASFQQVRCVRVSIMPNSA